MIKLVESIEYFIKCYEEVEDRVAGKELDVVEISGGEVKDWAKSHESRRKYKD